MNTNVNTADVNENATAVDGLVMARRPMYSIVIKSKGVENFRSTPMNEAMCAAEMQRIIKLHTVVMGYKQDPGATTTTLKKDNIRLEIWKVEVQR